MKRVFPFLILCFVFQYLSCTAQKETNESKSIAQYFQEIPEKFKFGYSLKKEGTDWLRVDDQGMPPEMRKIVLDEKEGYLQVGLSIQDNTDSVCIKRFSLKGVEILGVAYFNQFFNLNGGQVSGEIHFLKKENDTWKEITSEIMPKIEVQDFYNEKIRLKEGYTALKYEFITKGVMANLLVSYSAELDCMGGREGEVKGEAQKEGCVLSEKKKYDKIELKWDAEKTKLSVEKP